MNEDQLNDKNKQIEALLNDVKRHNNAALEKLIELLRSDLIKTAYGYLGDITYAEDVVNDFFAELSESCKKLKNSDNLMGWFKTVIVNKALNLRKKEKRRVYENFNEANAPLQSTEHIEENVMVRDCLARLCVDERTVLILRSYDYTLKEISDMVGYSIKKVRILEDKAKSHFIELYRKR